MKLHRAARRWSPSAAAVVLRPAAGSLSDVRPLLARIVDALGTNAAARLLDADRAQVSRWGGGKEQISGEMGRRIVDLHDILTRILRIYPPEAASMWLVGSEPLLGGARPIDVLVTEGAAPVVRAIDGLAQGAYACIAWRSFYRVFPYLPGAAPDEPGGALYVPPQGGGRLDNPDLYSVFYASDAEAGAIAEAFGRFPEWTPAILSGIPALPGSARAIATYRLDANVAVCNLDDPAQLSDLGLRPSDIVSRDYIRTREWARRLYRDGRWAGVRWWSYYDPRWASFAIWSLPSLSFAGLRPLTLADPAIAEAARAIARRLVPR
jgi:hypothetical protein